MGKWSGLVWYVGSRAAAVVVADAGKRAAVSLEPVCILQAPAAALSGLEREGSEKLKDGSEQDGRSRVGKRGKLCGEIE